MAVAGGVSVRTEEVALIVAGYGAVLSTVLAFRAAVRERRKVKLFITHRYDRRTWLFEQ
jgi:hypothetical protein